MCVLLRKDGDLIGILEDTAQDVVKLTGFFHSGPELHCHRIRPHPKLVSDVWSLQNTTTSCCTHSFDFYREVAALQR